MELIHDRLAAYGLQRFFNKHKFKLCNTLISLEDIGIALGMTDVDMTEYTSQKTVTMQASKLLHFIAMRNTPEEFLTALQDTANDKAVDYIGKALENEATLPKKKESVKEGEGEKVEEAVLSDSDRIQALKCYLGGSEKSLSEFLNPLLPDICAKLVGLPQFIVYLKAQKILSAYDADEINAIKTNFSKIDAIFSLIFKKELNDNIVGNLLDALLKTGNGDIIKIMYMKI